MSDGDPASRIRVVVADALGRPVRAPGLARWLAGVAPGRARGTVNVALVSDARVRELNRRYRRKDYATDVLSFPAAEQGARPPGRRRARGSTGSPRWLILSRSTDMSSVSAVVERFLGDIVIARGVARRQARDARHSELTELRVLALHGLLHLLGYDHEDDNGRMRRTEQRLRRKGGLREGLIERARVDRRTRVPPR
jgi:probable rRNA maturation factor